MSAPASRAASIRSSNSPALALFSAKFIVGSVRCSASARAGVIQILAHRSPIPVEILRIVIPAGDLFADSGEGGIIHWRIGQPVLAQQFGGDALAELGVVVPVDQEL